MRTKEVIVWFDTEDNARELQDGSETIAQVTSIAARSSTGKEFFSNKPVVCVEQFKKWLRSQGKTTAVAFNLSYDLGSLFGDSLEELDNALVLGSKFLEATWGDTKFKDAFKLLPMSLKAIGDSIGMKKLAFHKSAKAYVMRDVDILRKAWLGLVDFAEAHGVEKMPFTIGSLSVKIWEAMGGENWFCNNLTAREFLIGGRVEGFASHYRGDVCYTDINSLYPFAMTKPYPTSADPVTPRKAMDGYNLVIATVNVPDCFIAPLPVHLEDGTVMFPKGKFTGGWTTQELQIAIEHGTKLLKVHSAWGSKKAEYYYKPFVDRIYAERKASENETERLFLKLVMNNLYGKLGQRNQGDNLCRLYPMDKMKPGITRRFGDRALIPQNFPLRPPVNYMHAAFVTSYGRIELLKYLYQLGERVLYCDTDSVIFIGKKPPFSIGKSLGEMKLVDKDKFFRFWQPKCYQLGNRFTAKGVPKDNAEEFLTTGKTSYWTPYQLKEALRFYYRGNKKRLSTWHNVNKKMQTQYERKLLKGDKYWPRKLDN